MAFPPLTLRMPRTILVEPAYVFVPVSEVVEALLVVFPKPVVAPATKFAGPLIVPAMVHKPLLSALTKIALSPELVPKTQARVVGEETLAPVPTEAPFATVTVPVADPNPESFPGTEPLMRY